MGHVEQAVVSALQDNRMKGIEKQFATDLTQDPYQLYWLGLPHPIHDSATEATKIIKELNNFRKI